MCLLSHKLLHHKTELTPNDALTNMIKIQQSKILF
jgi:hypothetical protein